MQLCGQYGHPALAVKVNRSVDYFSSTYDFELPPG